MKLCSVISQTTKEIARVRFDFDSVICAMSTNLLDLEIVVKESYSEGGGGERCKACSVVIRNLKQGHNATEWSNSRVKNKFISLVRLLCFTFHNRDKGLTIKPLKQEYRYHKL